MKTRRREDEKTERWEDGKTGRQASFLPHLEKKHLKQFDFPEQNRNKIFKKNEAMVA